MARAMKGEKQFEVIALVFHMHIETIPDIYVLAMNGLLLKLS